MAILIFDLDPENSSLNIQITEVNSTKINISWNALPVCSQGADGLGYELEVKHLVSNTTSNIFMGFFQYQAYGITITPTNN